MKPLTLLLCLVWLATSVVARGADTSAEVLKAAKNAASVHQFDEALRLCERVIVEHPETPMRCYEAQMTIVTTLAAKGQLAEAAKAAHLAMDCAPTEAAFDNAVTLAANILSALDHNVGRANQLLAFQETGPVNGAINPLEAVGYPAMPERELAFDAVRQQAGDNVVGSRLRAYTFLLSGKPREAFAQFADAFHRSANLRDMQSAATDMASIGLRAVQGQRLDQKTALQFLAFGPNNTDEKSNTEDKREDPFADILPAPPAVGEGGLAALSATDLAALRHLRDAAKLYAGDPWVEIRIRRLAIIALQRANEALDDWGSAGQKDWYLQLALTSNTGYETESSLIGAQAAAKGRDLHLGGIAALWNEIDTYCAAHGIEPTPLMINIRKQFINTTTVLSTLQSRPPQVKYLQKPAAF